jgi:ABC-type lipoprotein export system ATPase subunit
MTELRLRADRVYRFYRAGDEETLAVQGVSLELVAGELVALSGPSGSGKSTLLSCLAGTDEPSGGTVWIAGERMSGRTEGERAAIRGRRVGTMAQSGNLFAHLTVLGNLRLARSMAGGHQQRDLPDPMELLASGLVGEKDGGTIGKGNGQRCSDELASGQLVGPGVRSRGDPKIGEQLHRIWQVALLATSGHRTR